MRASHFVVFAGVLVVFGCAVDVVPFSTSGSRSDGIVELTYDYGYLQSPRVDMISANAEALKRCNVWGYSGADPFEGQRSVCDQYGNLGCYHTTVTMKYQCTGAGAAQPLSAMPAPAGYAPPPQPMPAQTEAAASAPPPAASSIAPPVTRTAQNVATASLGISGFSVTQFSVAAYGMADPHGVCVSKVEVQGPAQRAGIQKGDIVVGFDGQRINDMDELNEYVASKSAGDVALVRFVRHGKVYDAALKF